MPPAVRLLKAAQQGEQPLQPDKVTYTTLMDGFTRAGQTHKALQVFEALPRLRVEPDEVCFQSAIAACAPSGNWEQACSLLERMAEAGFEPTARAASSAMTACTNGGRPAMALEVFRSIETDGRADGPLYSNAITAHTRAGDELGALACFRAMRRAGVQRDTIAYNAALHAACGVRRRSRTALRLWRLMKAERVAASDVTYSVLLQGLWDSEEAMLILDEAMARPGTFARCLEVSKSGWLLDLHRLSPGAAIALVLWLLSRLIKLELEAAPLPCAVRLVTGWGKHTPHWRKETHGGSSLRESVISLLTAYQVPFDVPLARLADLEEAAAVEGSPQQRSGQLDLRLEALPSWVHKAVESGLVRGCYDRDDLWIIQSPVIAPGGGAAEEAPRP